MNFVPLVCIFVLAAAAICCSGFIVLQTKRSYQIRTARDRFLLKDANKDAAKAEQWRVQQEILARRRDKPRMKEYFAQVEKTREAQSRKAKASLWSRSGDSEDPLSKWKASRDRGGVRPLGYEKEPSRADSKLGINVVIPLNPIGMPKYDAGERFDLRLPYAERGYVDEKADIMGRLFRTFTRKPEEMQPSKVIKTQQNQKPLNRLASTTAVGNSRVSPQVAEAKGTGRSSNSFSTEQGKASVTAKDSKKSKGWFW